MPKQIPSHARYHFQFSFGLILLTILLCVSSYHWPFAFQNSRTGFIAGQKLHAYIKMLQSPDLPLDEETTSFTDIPRGEFSYLQNSNIDVSNGQTQRCIVQCDIQEGLDFSITYHLRTKCSENYHKNIYLLSNLYDSKAQINSKR